MLFNLISPGAAKLFLTFSGHPSFKAPIKHNEISYKHLGVVQLSEVLEDAICRQDVKELKKKEKLFGAKPHCTNFSMALLHVRYAYGPHIFQKHTPRCQGLFFRAYQLNVERWVC